MVAQDAGQRGAVRGDQGRLVGGKHPLLKPRAPGVAACQQAVSRRRADCGRAVGIGEAHPFCHQLVQIGRCDLVIGIVGLNVADAEIVGKDHDDVGRPVGGVRRARERGGERQERGDALQAHWLLGTPRGTPHAAGSASVSRDPKPQLYHAPGRGHSVPRAAGWPIPIETGTHPTRPPGQSSLAGRTRPAAPPRQARPRRGGRLESVPGQCRTRARARRGCV